jgi:2-amino-4-hydroxy-6-hydroxymethyldihydropteridine diphosphokinase
MTLAYIGIGSNLSEPTKQVRAAILNLDSLPDTDLIAQSSLYCSKPQGPQDQPDFVNAVAKINTKLKPLELLNELQQQEKEQGKVKKRHWGERVIDLDILLFADEIISSEKLTLPHPQIHLRDFVLLPLAEIETKIVIPNQPPITDLIKQLVETFVEIKI